MLAFTGEVVSMRCKTSMRAKQERTVRIIIMAGFLLLSTR